jgi:L,D-transpeptidase YbiS
VSLRVSLAAQTLALERDGRVLKTYSVSTSKHGAGEVRGVLKNAVFRGRRPTGEIYSEALAAANPDRDWVLTRILWLSGTEIGSNRLGPVDTMRRYIYIHGTPDTEPLGVPGSIGCIRMSNRDVVELFDAVPAGTIVDIA